MRKTLKASAGLLIVALVAVGCASRTQTPPPQSPQTAQSTNTYDRETVIREAEGFFGTGAKGVATVIERVFQDLGRPTAYIAGQEVGGAFVGGVRYGDGMLYHKVEGDQKVHWTGPSVGFDIGGDASKSFTLVYNLNDTAELFQRFPAVEGKVYFIGGFSVNYHQRGNVVLAPIRLGAGWRLGANIGWLNYTKERTYIPF